MGGFFFLWEAEEERVAVASAGSDEAMNKDGGTLGGEGQRWK